MSLPLDDVRVAAASDELVASGLLGFVRFIAGDLRLDGIAVRHTREGRIALAYPERADRHGDRHPYFRPVDERARREIERQILDALVDWKEVAP